MSNWISKEEAELMQEFEAKFKAFILYGKSTMEKYYTPELEELHIGFEYEQHGPFSGWTKQILDIDLLATIINEEQCDWCDHHIRVKYLDREDIESFDFKQVGEYHPRKRYSLALLKGNSKIVVYDLHWHEGNTYSIKDEYEQYYFFGEIKNKSELRRILKQIKLL